MQSVEPTKLQVNEYQARVDIFKAEAKAYQEQRTRWEINRNAAVSKAEGSISVFQ